MIPQSVYEAVLDYGKASIRVGLTSANGSAQNFQAELDKMIEAQGHLLDLLHEIERG